MRRLPALITLSLAALGLATPLPPALDQRDPARAVALLHAYPDFVRSVKGGVLTWRDGVRWPLSRPHPAAPFEARLAGADLEDQFAQPYPAGCHQGPIPVGFDPGRLRDEAFFAHMYGETPAAVQAQLVPVAWFGETLLVTHVNGVDTHLRAVAQELAGHPEWRRFLTPSGGTYLWRDIAGTGRLSMHAYGAAIDLNTRYASYWRWTTHGAGYPMDVVLAFERHGFIWGGRWSHTDTMHFEYRPELLLGAALPAACPADAAGYAERREARR